MRPEEFWNVETFAAAAYLLRCGLDQGTIALKMGCSRAELQMFLDTDGYMQGFKKFYAEHESVVDALIEAIAKPSGWPESKRYLIERDKLEEET